ncbi:MAG TPA: sialate O-acetylesterase, partial [Bacteroidales bacterium]|nr:sialate O-acetylesterase [Bacteroidales bacterium]
MKSIAKTIIAIIAFGSCYTLMASEKPLKVNILAGQSNIQGPAHFRTFKAIGDDPETSVLLNVILDQNGDLVICDNAWITCLTQRDDRDTVLQGRIKVSYGFDHERIGPEYAFGIVMDKAHDEPALIIKTAWGGKSLAVDFRPTSSGPYVPSLKEMEQANVPSKDVVGYYYRGIIRHVRETQSNAESIRKIVPDYDPQQDFELAEFVWFQGWNDMCNRYYFEHYTENMINFISDVRKELDKPELPFRVAILEGYGIDPGSRKFDKSLPISDFRKAQFDAVQQYDQKVTELYCGNVIAVDSGPFYELNLSDVYWEQRLIKEWDFRVKQGDMTRKEAKQERKWYRFTGNGLTKRN